MLPSEKVAAHVERAKRTIRGPSSFDGPAGRSVMILDFGWRRTAHHGDTET